jgi:hypothetical protein
MLPRKVAVRDHLSETSAVGGTICFFANGHNRAGAIATLLARPLPQECPDPFDPRP